MAQTGHDRAHFPVVENVVDRKSILKNLLALILPLATIASAYLLDRWTIALRDEGSRTYQYTLVISGTLVANLIIVVLLLSIVWMIFVRGYGNKPVAIVFLFSGLIVIVLPWSSFLIDPTEPMFSFIGPGTTGGIIRMALMESGLKSWTTFSSLYVVVIGIVRLLSR